MASQKQQVQARERARKAKARLDAQRADHDRKVEAAATQFFEAQGDHEQALEAAASADAAMVSAVGEMVELGLTNAQISMLCELAETEVRAARKRARELASSAGQESLPDDQT